MKLKGHVLLTLFNKMMDTETSRVTNCVRRISVIRMETATKYFCMFTNLAY